MKYLKYFEQKEEKDKDKEEDKDANKWWISKEPAKQPEILDGDHFYDDEYDDEDDDDYRYDEDGRWDLIDDLFDAMFGDGPEEDDDKNTDYLESLTDEQLEELKKQYLDK